MGPDNDAVLQELGDDPLLGPLIKDVIYRWSVTQSKTFTQQLEAGIRYFDLRIACKPHSDDIYVLHGLYGQKLETLLQEIAAFLRSHPKEVVLLDVNHTYNMTDFLHKQCLSMILEICGYSMCPFKAADSLTLEKLWSKHQQVVVFYHDDSAKQNLMFWSGDYIPNPWPETDNLKELMGILETNYQKPRSPNQFYVTQGVLTPTFFYIVTHVEKSLKGDLDTKVAQPFIDWLKTKKSGAQGINICILDFVEMAEYVPMVIGLNNSLL